MIHQLNPTIDVETPLGYGKAIAWIDFSEQLNSIWKVVLYATGECRNFYDDDIRVYPNKMDGGKIVIPENWKQNGSSDLLNKLQYEFLTNKKLSKELVTPNKEIIDSTPKQRPND